MSTVVSVLTTKDGQGSTGFALSLAWATAERRRVILVDADMSGTGTLADTIALDFGGRGIGNLFGSRAITPAMLEQQAVAVRARPRLRVVAGLQGFSGPGVADLLARMVPALQSVPDELVVLDLGAPLAHPGQESPRRTGETIAQASQRVFVVVQDSPARLVRSIHVLKAAQLPQAELVLHETRRGALRDQLRGALAEHLPGVRISAILPWDERRAVRAEDAAVPITIPDLPQMLHILQPGRLQGTGLPMPTAR
jgi:MinD-like ATPase involved in chromosome partitioning or flagellar assembly